MDIREEKVPYRIQEKQISNAPATADWRITCSLLPCIFFEPHRLDTDSGVIPLWTHTKKPI